MPKVEIYKGLKGVYFDTTQASFIDGEVGKLLYRGYNIHELAPNSTYEETGYLLLYGKLPTRSQLQAFDQQLRESRSIPQAVTDIIRAVKDAHPMDVLRTAVSALATFDPDVNDNSQDATRRKGIRLTSQCATIVATHYRIRQGLRPVKPSTELNHAGNFLYMLFDRKYPEDEVILMDKDFIVHAEHGSNASAFSARVTAATLADLHCAITAGIATLKGPLHGGAAEEVQKMTDEIGEPSRAAAYVARLRESGGRIMGFGHRVYKAEDPRARHLREVVKGLGEKRGSSKFYQILSAVAEAMKPLEAKGIYQNVDFWAGAVYTMLGIPSDLFIPIFALGRIPGWTLQVMEQYSDNVLIRPLQEYIGPMDLKYVPIDQRS